MHTYMYIHVHVYTQILKDLCTCIFLKDTPLNKTVGFSLTPTPVPAYVYTYVHSSGDYNRGHLPKGYFSKT